MLKMNLQLFAHKKGVGSTKNGRDYEAKRLGATDTHFMNPHGLTNADHYTTAYDLYLRERLKKRPSFAADQKPYESAVWAYRKEHRISRTSHIEVFPGGKAILFDYENRNPLSNNATTENVVLRMDNEIE